MNNRHNVVVDRYSSYYFKDEPSKVNSIPIINQENIPPSRNLIQFHYNPSNYHHQRATITSNHHQSTKLLKLCSSQTQLGNRFAQKQGLISQREIGVLTNRSINVQRLPRVESCSKLEIKGINQTALNSSRKKSVRFKDQPILISSNKASNCQKNVSRGRSSSILKSTLTASNRSKSQYKIGLPSSSGNHCTISQYKSILIRQKYKNILNSYLKHQQFSENIRFKSYSSANSLKMNKYCDSNFPLIQSSVFKNKQKISNQIKWARISQIFAGKKIVVLASSQYYSSIATKTPAFCGNEQFIALLNLIGECRGLLNRIFENLVYNESGVYMLRIYHQFEWKYIIIDDNIPLILNQSKETSYNPVFTQIRPKNRNVTQRCQVQIWPFLLEKAYASALGSYQAVHEGSLLNYFCQMMGLPLQKIILNNKNTDWKEQIRTIQPSQSIVFGVNKVNKNNQLKNQKYINRVVSIHRLQPRSNGQKYQILYLQSQSKKQIDITELPRYIQSIYILKMQNIKHLSQSLLIGYSNLNKSIPSLSYSTSLNPNLLIQKQKLLIKTFTTSKSEEISIILKRKNQQFNNDRPFWLRVFLFMKQFDSYRWIEGRYSKQFITISCILQPGNYYIVVLPDWTIEITELVLMVYSRLAPVELNNYLEAKEDNIIQKGCADYAQRLGKLMQINKWLCTYTIVDSQSGLIIENVHNQRRSGKVKILRSIKDLRPKDCWLLPYNKEFYNNSILNYDAEILIDKMNNNSVILMMFRGRDQQFMSSFNFGP